MFDSWTKTKIQASTPFQWQNSPSKIPYRSFFEKFSLKTAVISATLFIFVTQFFYRPLQRSIFFTDHPCGEMFSGKPTVQFSIETES